MVPKQISSLQHPIVKKLVRIRDQRSAREEEGEVLICGRKLVSELAQGPGLGLLLLPNGEEPPSTWRYKQLIWLEVPLFKKITGLVNPEPIAATISLPPPSSLSEKRWILALDQVSDPGNVGTLMRSALGLGWQGIFFLNGCADLFNEKALRAAKGATFFLPYATGDDRSLLALSKEAHLPIWIADLEGTLLKEAPKEAGGILILGSEGGGVSASLKQLGLSITIPLSEQMESLNVAAAGAILLYELKTHGR